MRYGAGWRDCSERKSRVSIHCRRELPFGCIFLSQFFQFIGNFDFQTPANRFVKAGLGHPIGQIALSSGKTVFLVVCIAVTLAVVQLLHKLGGGIAQMHGHRAGAVFFDPGLGLVEGQSLTFNG